MCGIAGCFTANPGEPNTVGLERALLRLRHRGPNGQGVERFETEGGELILGHRRLSIIDLSDAGLQPMASADGRYTVTFNGEIYNYIELREELQAKGRRFSTHTDTEVLIEAWSEWGSQALERSTLR